MPGRRRRWFCLWNNNNNNNKAQHSAQVQPALGTQDLPLLPDELDPTEDDVVGVGVERTQVYLTRPRFRARVLTCTTRRRRWTRRGRIDARWRLTHADPTKPSSLGTEGCLSVHKEQLSTSPSPSNWFLPNAQKTSSASRTTSTCTTRSCRWRTSPG